MTADLPDKPASEGGWRMVVWSADCDEDGCCPVCDDDYSECSCPGPTMDGMEYKWVDGVLYARPEDQPDEDL